ncbi:MAG: tetratricopeptide repeat protein [bacterium]
MKRISCFSFVLLVSVGLRCAQASDPVAEAAELSNQGRHAEAASILQRALEMNPGDEGLRFRLATALVFDHRNSEARAAFLELAKSWNADIAAMAVTSLAALDRAEAVEKAARARPPSQEELQRRADYQARQARLNRQQLAYDLVKAHRDAEAVQAIDDLERHGEVTPDLIMEKAAALERLGDPLAAIVVLRDVAGGDNPDPRARLQLASLLAGAGRRSEAYEIWREIRDQTGDATLSRVAASEIDALSAPYNLDRWAWGELDLFGTYLSRYDIGVSSGRLREGTFLPGARWIEPFVQADFSLDSTNSSKGPGQGIPTIYNENLAGFHAGVRVRPVANQSLVLYALGGVQKDLRGTEEHNGEWFAEIIAGLNGYWSWGPGKEWTAIDLESLSPGGLPSISAGKQSSRWSLNNWSPVRLRFDWFVEAGGDAAYYSRLPDCLAYGQSRQGARLAQFGKAGAVDIYALENLTMDTKGNYYDNYIEAGPGVRFVTAPVGAAVLTTSLDYVLGSYLGRNSNNTRGDTAANYSDLRLTVALSLRW